MECFASFVTKKTGEKGIGRKLWFFSFEGKGKNGRVWNWEKRWDPLNFIDDSQCEHTKLCHLINFMDSVNIQNFAT